MGALQTVHVLNYASGTIPAGTFNPATIAASTTSPQLTVNSAQIQEALLPTAAQLAAYPAAGSQVWVKWNYGPTVIPIHLICTEAPSALVSAS